MANPIWYVNHGNQFPYDASDEWNNGTGADPPAPTGWAHSAARGVIANMTDRSGIKHAFNEVDEETRVEMVSTLASIIRAAKEAGDV